MLCYVIMHRFRHLIPKLLTINIFNCLICQRKLEDFGLFTPQTDYIYLHLQSIRNIHFVELSIHICVNAAINFSFLQCMTLTTVQVVGKAVYIFMNLGIYFPLLFQNARWADAEKEKKEQNSRCGGREVRSAPPSFQPQYKERGEKNPSFNDSHASYSLSQRGRGQK